MGKNKFFKKNPAPKSLKKTGAFECVVCGLHDSVSITVNKKKKVTTAKCSSASCLAKFEATGAQEEYDVLARWADQYKYESVTRAALRKKEEAAAKAEAEATTTATVEASSTYPQDPAEVVWTEPLCARAPSHATSSSPSVDTTKPFRFTELSEEDRNEIYRIYITSSNGTSVFMVPIGGGPTKPVKLPKITVRAKERAPGKTKTWQDQTLTTDLPLSLVSKQVNQEYHNALRKVVYDTSEAVLLLRAWNWDFGTAADFLKKLCKKDFEISTTARDPATGVAQQEVYYNPDVEAMHENLDELQEQVRRLGLGGLVQPVIEATAHPVRLGIPGSLKRPCLDENGYVQAREKQDIKTLAIAWTAHCKSLIANDSPDKDVQREPTHEFCICRTFTSSLDVKCEHVNPVSDEQEEIWWQNKLARDAMEEQE